MCLIKPPYQWRGHIHEDDNDTTFGCALNRGKQPGSREGMPVHLGTVARARVQCNARERPGTLRSC